MGDGTEDNELMLELSIGGIFGKPNRNMTESTEKDLSVQSNGVVQAIRRKKLMDHGSCGSVSGPFVENKDWLEAQIVRPSDGPSRKKEKIGDVPEKVCDGTGGGGQVVAPVEGDVNYGFRPTACRSFRPYNGGLNLKANEDEIDGGGGRSCKINSNGCGSSGYSDGQCSSRQGCTTDESRSYSSNSQLDQQPASTSTTSVEPSEQPICSSKQTISTTNLTNPTMKPNDRSNTHESSVSNPPSKPEPSNQNQQASLLARMPCVSTTGNGPNGKTISGFLYRYTKNEVSIVCVCHGRTFSPAGFVEHAGGVDITHPLKHITIFPAAFAS